MTITNMTITNNCKFTRRLSMFQLQAEHPHAKDLLFKGCVTAALPHKLVVNKHDT